jgi:hypothetical protein
MNDSAPPPAYDPLPRLKRLGFVFLLLFALWAFVVYLLPHGKNTLLKPDAAAPSVSIPVPAPASPPAQLSEPFAPAPPAALPWQKEPSENTMEQRIATLETRMKALEDSIAAMPKAGSVSLPDLEAAIKTQQSALVELKDAAGKNNRLLAAVTALGQLKESLGAGNSYREPWKRLADAISDRSDLQPLLATLETGADSGIPTFTTLQMRFDAAIPHALSPDSGGWTDTLRTLVRIRKVGAEQPGMDDESVIARAEASLAQGDVATAVKELEQLSPSAVDAMADWKHEAKHYLDAQAAMNGLAVAVLLP